MFNGHYNHSLNTDVTYRQPYANTDASLVFFFLLAGLGLCCCTWAFSSYGWQGLLSSCGEQAFLIAVVSLVGEQGL